MTPTTETTTLAPAADPRQVAALTIGLALECRRFGDRRRGDLSKVDTEDTDQTLLNLTKRLVPRKTRGENGRSLPAAALAAARALRKIERLDDVAQDDLKRLGLPSYFKAGTHRISLGLIDEVERTLSEKAKAREPLVEDFCRLYPDLIDAMAEPLGVQFERADYPSVETVRARFAFTWTWFPLDEVPDVLKQVSPATYRAARKRIEASREQIAAGIRSALRQDAAETVEAIAGKLAGPGEDARKFRESTILRDLDEFLRTFPLRNVTGDTELTDWLDGLRRVVQAVDLEALKTDAAGQAVIKGTLENILKRAPRVIALE